MRRDPTRREFLRRSSSLVAGSSLAGLAAACADPNSPAPAESWDLLADPEEARNLAALQPDQVRRLRDWLPERRV